MFKENLKKYRRYRNITQEELADKINKITNKFYTKETVKSWEKGTNPKIETIEAIANVLNIPIQYLFNDSLESKELIVKDVTPEYNEIIEHVKKVYVLNGYAGAGSAGCVNGDIDNFIYIDKSFLPSKYINKDVKALYVIGDSMRPFVEHGDIVLYYELESGAYNLPDGKYIITTINGTMVKNLTFKTNGDIVISSCNEIYREEIIKAKESQEFLDIVGFVIGRILKS